MATSQAKSEMESEELAAGGEVEGGGGELSLLRSKIDRERIVTLMPSARKDWVRFSVLISIGFETETIWVYMVTEGRTVWIQRHMNNAAMDNAFIMLGVGSLLLTRLYLVFDNENFIISLVSGHDT